MSRRDRDGKEISRPTIAYLVADDIAGLRILLLATHGQ
jgi:hypothetical protein